MSDIHPKGIHAGDQYGTTIHKSDSIIDFPKRQSIPGYGTRIQAAKPAGGSQYGTTIEKSQPYRTFPNANKPLKSNTVPQKGSAMKIDSEKVVISDQRPGLVVGKLNGSTKKTASQSGSGGPTDRPYPLATHYPLKSGGMSDMTPNQFQDQ